LSQCLSCYYRLIIYLSVYCLLYILVLFLLRLFSVFFFNDTATTEIYTLSLHDALPISAMRSKSSTRSAMLASSWAGPSWMSRATDRKSTRLNSSHVKISYAVFCLKKKKKFDQK